MDERRRTGRLYTCVPGHEIGADVDGSNWASRMLGQGASPSRYWDIFGETMVPHAVNKSTAQKRHRRIEGERNKNNRRNVRPSDASARPWYDLIRRTRAHV